MSAGDGLGTFPQPVEYFPPSVPADSHNARKARPSRWHALCSFRGVPRFLMRFLGVLVLDPVAFEDIEADRRAAMQSAIVVATVCLSSGFAAAGQQIAGTAGFASGVLMALGAWLVWVMMIAALGPYVMAEPQTKSDFPELLRVLGFAAAPGVFIALAAMPALTPLVVVVVAIWMVTAAVLGLRQALDYRSTARAAAVCVISWLLSFGVMAAIATLFTRTVS
jgi:Yip1 domain